MFGSKKRAKVKAEQLRMKDEAVKAKYKTEDERIMKYYQENYPKTQGNGIASVTVKESPNTEPMPLAKWSTDSDEPETTIEGTLGNGVKFHLEFDDESSKKNLQMIVAVLNLHIAEFNAAEHIVASEKASLKAEIANKEYNENVRREKALKEQREHELKVIAARKDANIPLAPSQLNGQIGNGASATYKLNTI